MLFALASLAVSAADSGLQPVFVPAKLIKQVDVRPPSKGLLGFRGTAIEACFTITTEGKVKDITFPNPGRQEFFDIPIKRALVRWRFEPATQDGAPVEQPGCVVVQIRAIGG